jgi:hypothetical protein
MKDSVVLVYLQLRDSSWQGLKAALQLPVLLYIQQYHERKTGVFSAFGKLHDIRTSSILLLSASFPIPSL